MTSVLAVAFIFALATAMAVVAQNQQQPSPFSVNARAHPNWHNVTRNLDFSEGNFQAKCGRLLGFYAMPCHKVSTAGPNNKDAVSMVQTRHYYQNYTYEIDTTYYVGDPECKPVKSDVYYKTWMTGKLQVAGPNKLVKGATRASLDWSGGKYLVAKQSRDAKYLTQALNKYCPCGGTWAPGVQRAIGEKSCTTYNSFNPNAPRLCNIVAGLVDYFNYEQVPDCEHYITSRDCFTDANTCWNNPVTGGWVRQRINQGGDYWPEDCDYTKWAKCGSGIKDAAKTCDTCEGLECDGCLFRELNPNWDPSKPNLDVDDWSSCCPCMYQYAQKYNLPWMHPKC